MKDEFVKGLYIVGTWRDTIAMRVATDQTWGPDFPIDPISGMKDVPTSRIIASTNSTWSSLVLVDFLLQKNDDVHEFLTSSPIIGGSHISGGRAATSTDQMTAISVNERHMALQVLIIGIDDQTKYLDMFQQYHPMKPTAENPVVPVTELNHSSPAWFGPLKSNLS